MNTNIVLSLDTRREKSDGSFPIMLRLSHHGKTTGIATGYAVPEKFWDDTTRKIKKGCPQIENLTRVNNHLDKLRSAALDEITRLNDTKELNKLSITDLKTNLFKKEKRESFFKYTKAIVDGLRAHSRMGTARSYENTLREVQNFTQGKDFAFQELTYQWLIRFESWYMRKERVGLNGLGFYMRNIKAIINRAIREKLLAKDAYPFENYRIKSSPTKKRALPVDAIQRIAALQLGHDPLLFETRNIFLLSFYTMGMPYIDLAFLKLSDIVDGRIQYRRQKTGKFMDIKITEIVKPILDYFTTGKAKSDYVLPIIKRVSPADQYKDMMWARRVYNLRLREIAALAGIEEKLTSYVSRHSFASAANNMAIPLTAISEMMGHQRISTTQVYLAGLQKEALDNYNDLIIGAKNS